MIETLIGIILLAAPFMLLGLFRNTRRGFVSILFFLISFHVLLAVTTQLLGIFYYWLIVIITGLADLILVFYFIKREPQFKFPKIDWILLIVIAISCITLYQVHYNYTGKINLATDRVVSYHEVKDMKYVYPYFSDEWYAVSLAGHSINSHSLPTKNTLSSGPFLNLEMFFHSLVAEIMLLASLDPLTQYIIVSILINVLIIVLAYVFLRINNVSRLTAALSSLSILYITCGANLPGVWHLIPVHLGIIFSLIGLCFIAMDNFFMAALSALPVIFFYGPLLIFYGLSLAVFAFLKFFKTPQNIFRVISYSLITLFLILPIICVILMISPLSGVSGYIASKIFYVSFTGFSMPQLYFYNIIPIWTILLAILGISFVFKSKKWLFASFLMGVFYWLFYFFSIYRFVIEYERAIFFTSIVIVLISGFGLEELGRYINSKIKNNRFRTFKYLEVGAIVLFLLFIPFYTQRENWKKLISIDPRSRAVSFPKSPANNYLTGEDLRIFKDIQGKKFLSIPWKGTTIGIATNNYPVVAKPGTISVGEEIITDVFLNSDCQQKASMAKDTKLDYVYVYQFNCPGFEKIEESLEGLVLYKVNI